MKLRNLGASRRSLVIAAAAVATVISLGIGANAALNKISNDARQAVFNIGRRLRQGSDRIDRQFRPALRS